MFRCSWARRRYSSRDSPRTTACSTASNAPAPSSARARLVCSTVTRYESAPSVRSAARRSILGPRAARTTGTARVVLGAQDRGGIERVEVGRHRGERRVVHAAASPLHQRAVADPEAEDEPALRGVGKCPRGGRRRHRVARVDRRDARRDHEVPGALQQELGAGHRLAPVGLGEPQGPEARSLEALGDLAEPCGADATRWCASRPRRSRAAARAWGASLRGYVRSGRSDRLVRWASPRRSCSSVSSASRSWHSCRSAARRCPRSPS